MTTTPSRAGPCPDLEPAAGERAPGGLQLRGRAADERPPAPDGLGSVQAKGIVAVQVAGVRVHPVAIPRLRPHGDAFGDRERQRETVVVVSVLADQIHASGGKRDHLVTHPVLSRA